jgi:DNA-binding CsgD family transcriptional regulator
METAQAPVTLTDRQRAVLTHLLAEPYQTYEEIAHTLGISLNGVRGHVLRIQTKLGVRKRRDIPYAARVKGLA